ncbi:SIMPL domain-containing protein [Natronorubrum halophilum]|uniref:SIMPL domain-containing protein n=1 Tax=Natronorubrum halophilum TaxID=1702106 RepID=UPI000EF73795|nr:SIMPL domain-containing protein [Natronorubrum halophilum]
MDRRQFLAASGVGVAITTAGCVDGVLGTAAGSESDANGHGAPPEDDPGNAIEVRGEGVVEVEPDRAILTIGVEASGETADEVTDELAGDAETLREAFDELGLPEENVESGRFNVRQVHNGTGYEGHHSFRVEFDDPDRAGEVIDAATAAGADTVGRVQFDLQDATREERRNEALDRALANADEEAAHIASNRGVEITGTRSVSTSDVGVRPVYETATDDAAAAEGGGAPPTEIDAGPVRVTASVTVTYSFADAE